ncbi:MAG: hypothetical protein HZC14_02555 [Candidatus Niyogibacteria bacterium]|nr:hypothetical protein [Candidatus Niyogibacteria bacterium]
MKDRTKKFWQLIKAGIIPLFVASIPIYLCYWTWVFVDNNGLHLLGKSYYDVPITIAIAILSACLCGFMVTREWFINFAKEFLLEIPMINWLVAVFILPKRKLNLVEVRTVCGQTPEEGCWEYGMEPCDPWTENGITYHRVHTLGWMGRLFSMVDDKNIRPVTEPPHKIWLRIFSLGIL